MSFRYRKLGRVITSRPGPGKPIPTWIPGGHEVARRMADLIGGDADGALTDLVDIPMTAHFLGGCAIGATAQDGVIDVVRTSGERSENTTVSMLRSSPRRARR